MARTQRCGDIVPTRIERLVLTMGLSGYGKAHSHLASRHKSLRENSMAQVRAATGLGLISTRGKKHRRKCRMIPLDMTTM